MNIIRTTHPATHDLGTGMAADSGSSQIERSSSGLLEWKAESIASNLSRRTCLNLFITILIDELQQPLDIFGMLPQLLKPMYSTSLYLSLSLSLSFGYDSACVFPVTSKEAASGM